MDEDEPDDPPADYAELETETQRELETIVATFFLGTITLAVFFERFLDTLEEGHAFALYLGRRRAGSDIPFNPADEAFGIEAGMAQAEYLVGFVESLRAAETQGDADIAETGQDASPPDSVPFEGYSKAQALARAGLYAAALYSSAAVGFVTESERRFDDLPESESGIETIGEDGQRRQDGELYDWILSRAENCEDCKRLARNGPYTADDLPTFPAFGDTVCRTRCRCVVRRRSDGREWR